MGAYGMDAAVSTTCTRGHRSKEAHASSLPQYYLAEVVLVATSCGSACIAQVSGPVWAVAPSTEHKKTPRITQNGQPGHKWQPKTIKFCRVPTPPPRRQARVAEWLLTDVKAHHEH